MGAGTRVNKRLGGDKVDVAAKISSQIDLFLPCQRTNNKITQKFMFRKLRDLYREYKEYVRVDLVMYAVMLLMIILYIVYSLLA